MPGMGSDTGESDGRRLFRAGANAVADQETRSQQRGSDRSRGRIGIKGCVSAFEIFIKHQKGLVGPERAVGLRRERVEKDDIRHSGGFEQLKKVAMKQFPGAQPRTVFPAALFEQPRRRPMKQMREIAIIFIRQRQRV